LRRFCSKLQVVPLYCRSAEGAPIFVCFCRSKLLLREFRNMLDKHTLLKFEPLQLPWSMVPALFATLVLTACSSAPPTLVENPETPATTTRSAADIQRINELERQQSQRQRHCLEEKRRLELELKESQKRGDDLQQRLDAVLAIDRELRRGSKGR